MNAKLFFNSPIFLNGSGLLRCAARGHDEAISRFKFNPITAVLPPHCSMANPRHLKPLCRLFSRPPH